jgi:hypothetical protein
VLLYYELWVSGKFPQAVLDQNLPSELYATATTAQPSTTAAADGDGDGDADAAYVDLLEAGALSEELEKDGDGALVFDGQTAVAVETDVPRLGSNFSIVVHLTAKRGNAGYVVAKGNADDGEVYSLYFTASSQRVYFFYSVDGTSQFVRFAAAINDGSPHAVLLAVAGTEATLHVDGERIGTDDAMASSVDDCGTADGCSMFLGKRPDSSGAMYTGVLRVARIYPSTTLSAFPEGALEAPPLATTTTAAAAETTADGSDRPSLLMYAGLDRSAVVQQLLPAEPYTFYVKPRNRIGATPSARARAVTNDAAPEGVGRPVAVGVFARTVNLTWSEPERPNGVITRYVVSLLDNGRQTVYDGSRTSAVVGGLEPFSEYVFGLSAYTSAGGTSGSAVQLRTLEAAPEGVATPTLSGYGARSATLEWRPPTKPNGKVTAHSLLRDGTEVYRGEALQFGVEGLVPFQTYRFVVGACTAAACGYGDGLNVTTDADTPDGQAGPTYASVAPTEVIVRWRKPAAPNGKVLGYELWRRRQPDGGGDGEPVLVYNSSGERTFTDVGLASTTTYAYQVVVYTASGKAASPYTTVVTADRAPFAVAPPTCVPTAFTLTCTWAKPTVPDGLAVTYVLGIQDAAARDDRTATAYEGSATTARIVELKPIAEYTLLLVACNVAGCTAAAKVTFSTMEGPPKFVNRPNVTGTGPRSFAVAWTAPVQPNGKITSYTVYMLGTSVVPFVTSGTSSGLQIENHPSVGPFSTRRFILQACTRPNMCTTSNTVEARSLEAAPTAQAPPEVEVLGNGSAIVTWSEPASPNGVITEYAAFYRKAEDQQGRRTRGEDRQVDGGAGGGNRLRSRARRRQLQLLVGDDGGFGGGGPCPSLKPLHPLHPFRLQPFAPFASATFCTLFVSTFCTLFVYNFLHPFRLQLFAPFSSTTFCTLLV